VTIQSASIDATVKKVVMDAAGTYTATIQAIIDSSLSSSQKALLTAGAATANMAVTLGATMANALTADQRAILNATAGTINQTLAQAVTLGTLTQDQRTILYKSAGTINSTLEMLAKGGTLTEDQRAILQQATATATKTVQMLVNDSSLTADQKKYLNLASLTNASVTMSGSVTFNPDSAQLSIWKSIMFGIGMIVTSVGAVVRLLAKTYETQFKTQYTDYWYSGIFSESEFNAKATSLRNTIL